MTVPSPGTWLRGSLLGHPRWVWLLWAGAAAVLAACPMMLSDPAMWMYLVDPELLALLVIVGFQYTRWEFGLAQTWLAARMRRGGSSDE